MTKRLSAAYAEALLDSSAPNLTSVNLKIVALDATHVDDVAHDFLDDISGGDIVATSGNLASKTITDGTFDAADVSLGSPSSGGPITQFWLYYDSGSAATSLLIYYWDEDAAGSAISITPNSEEITVQVNASGFFTIGS